MRRITRYERLLSFFYFYPFRCQLCDRIFTVFQPGIRYIRVDEDRREHQRIAVEFPMWLTKDTLNSKGRAVDLSMSGCTVRTDLLLPLSSVISVRLQIPDEPDPLTIEAAIVRNVGKDRLGLEFLRFQGDEKHRLRRVLQKLMTEKATGFSANSECCSEFPLAKDSH
jgi:PilZ domain